MAMSSLGSHIINKKKNNDNFLSSFPWQWNIISPLQLHSLSLGIYLEQRRRRRQHIQKVKEKKKTSWQVPAVSGTLGKLKKLVSYPFKWNSNRTLTTTLHIKYGCIWGFHTVAWVTEVNLFSKQTTINLVAKRNRPVFVTMKGSRCWQLGLGKLCSLCELWGKLVLPLSTFSGSFPSHVPLPPFCLFVPLSRTLVTGWDPSYSRMTPYAWVTVPKTLYTSQVTFWSFDSLNLT